MKGLPATFFILGLVTLLLTLPLVFRKIPMNRYYGFRVKAAFESPEKWYEINARGGKMLAWGSLAILIVGAIGFFVPERHTLWYIGGALIVLGVAIFGPLVSFVSWLRRFEP